MLAKERAAIRRAVQQTRAAAPKYLPKPEEEEQKGEEKEPKPQGQAYAHDSVEGARDVVSSAIVVTGGAEKGVELAGGRSGRETTNLVAEAAATATSATATAAMATATAATATATAATATATAATATATAANATASAVINGEKGCAQRRSSRTTSAARLGERVEKARYLAAELAKQMQEIEERAASLAECDRIVAAARSSSSTGIGRRGSLSPSLDEHHPKMWV